MVINALLSHYNYAEPTIPRLGYPSPVHTAPASVSSQESSQTEPQTPFRQTSTRPSRWLAPFTSLVSQSEEQTALVDKQEREWKSNPCSFL